MTPGDKTPVLSGATGGYQEVRLVAGLNRHLQCIWSNTLARGRSVDLAVLPDGKKSPVETAEVRYSVLRRTGN